MTSEKRELSKSFDSAIVLVIQRHDVVRVHNHSDTGPAIPIIASLILDEVPRTVYIAGIDLLECLGELNIMMQTTVPGWMMRLSQRKRVAYLKDGLQMVGGRTFVDYFAIDSKVGRNGKRQKRRRFNVINLEMFLNHPPTDPTDQLEMSLSILQLCAERGITYRPTKGGIGSALLKASKHWERGRRAAPAFVNEAARKELPGNFYSLSHKVRKSNFHFTERLGHCYYLDQSTAHHAIVASIGLPHPHFIRARGNYNQALKGIYKPWTKFGSDLAEHIINDHMGMVLCRMTAATLPPTKEHLYPPWAFKQVGVKGGREKYTWLWTPEFRLLRDEQRLNVDSLIAACTATRADPVLPEYAEWALDYIRESPGTKIYTKPILLAAYGMLAFNPGGRSIYRYWGGDGFRGEKVNLARAGVVAERRIKIPESVQYAMVNIIARGLIEAETRTRTLEYAKELDEQGFHVAQLYADGLLIEAEQLPFIKPGWRVSHSLTNVYLPRINAIISDQIVKLPGVSRTEEEEIWMDRRQKSLKKIHTSNRTLLTI